MKNPSEYLGIHVGVDIISISTEAYALIRARRVNIVYDVEKDTITLSPAVKGEGFAVNAHTGTVRLKLHRIIPVGRYLLTKQEGKKLEFTKQ